MCAALSSLEVNKSIGPDSIPAIVLKTCTPVLTSVLMRHFSLSYATGKVLSSWIVVNVYPMFKKGDSTDLSNYRPIVITCLLLRAME